MPTSQIFVSLLVIAGAAASFTSKILSFETVTKQGAILNPKTVNIQGYSELREPIRTHVNRYPLIWWILIVDNLFTLYNEAFLCTSTLESQVYESSDYIRSKMIFGMPHCIMNFLWVVGARSPQVNASLSSCLH